MTAGGDRALLRGPFGRLLLALTVTFVGDGVYLVALAWLALDLGDAATLAFAGGAWSVGILLALPLGGVLADTRDRRLLLLLMDLLRAGALGTIGVLSVTGALDPVTLAALSLLHGFGDGVAEPAVAGLVPRLVPADRLVRANGWMESVKPIALRVVGPGLGALLIAVSSAGVAMLVDAVTFLVCAAVVATLPAQPRADGGRAGSIAREVRDGWRYVRGARWLWPILLASTGALLATWGALEVLVAVRVKEDLDLGAWVFAAFLGGFGVGQALGGQIAGRHRPRRDLAATLLVWMVSAGSIAAYALAASWAAFVAVGAVTGALMSAGGVWWWTGVQQRVPDSHLGRVASIDHGLSLALAPLSLAVVPALAALLGTRSALVLCGAAALVCFAVPLLVGEVRDAEHPSETGGRGAAVADAGP